MKKHLIKLTAIAGLAVAISSPANADPGNPGFTVRFGPAYVNYNDGYRHDSGYRRYDRNVRHWRKDQRRHRKQDRRQRRAHDRRDRYYYNEH
jgi:hypothetical protein